MFVGSDYVLSLISYSISKVLGLKWSFLGTAKQTITEKLLRENTTNFMINNMNNITKKSSKL